MSGGGGQDCRPLTTLGSGGGHLPGQSNRGELTLTSSLNSSGPNTVETAYTTINTARAAQINVSANPQEETDYQTKPSARQGHAAAASVSIQPPHEPEAPRSKRGDLEVTAQTTVTASQTIRAFKKGGTITLGAKPGHQKNASILSSHRSQAKIYNSN